jgi:hypothetical protein
VAGERVDTQSALIPEVRPLPPRLEARAVLALAFGGIILVALVALYLAAYPAFIKFSPGFAARLGTPYRLGLKLQIALYLLAFAVLLPAAVVAAARQARALERRAVDPTVVALLNIAVLTAVLVAARGVLSGAPGPIDPHRKDWVHPVSIGVLLAVAALAVANVIVTLRPGLLSGHVVARPGAALVGALLLSALVFVPGFVFTADRALAAAAIAGVAFFAWRKGSAIRVSRRVGLIAEAGAVLVTILVVWDVHWPSGRAAFAMAKYNGVYLGPANSVLHGGAMLVDTFTQYGAGLSYFFAGLFEAIPIGYGTFALVVTALDVVLYVLMYAILRLAGTSRLVAFAGMFLAALTGILTHPGAYTIVPNRPARLLLPMIVVLLFQLIDRYPARRSAFTWAIAATLGFASIWATEVFFYAALGALAALACQARIDAPAGRRLLVDRRFLIQIVGAVVAAQIVFAAVTRALTGAFPDWAEYVRYQQLYAGGARSQFLAPFGPGMLLGAFYFASVAVSVVLLIWNTPFVREHRSWFTTLCAVEGVAVAYYSYYIGQADVVNLHKMAPMTVMLATMWVGFLGSRREPSAVAPRFGLTVLALWCVTAQLLAQHSVLATRLGETALGAGPSAAIHDIRFAASSPVVDPGAPAATAFVRRTTGTSSRVLVFLPDVLTTEVMMRADKALLLPIGDPYQDALLTSRAPYLEGLVDALPIGTRFVTRDDYFERSRPDPGISELNLQLLHELRKRFVLRSVEAGPGGLRLYRLEGRR